MTSLLLTVRSGVGGSTVERLGPLYGNEEITDNTNKVLLEVGSDKELADIEQVVNKQIAAGNFPIDLLFALQNSGALSTTTLKLNGVPQKEFVHIIIPNARKRFSAVALEP